MDRSLTPGTGPRSARARRLRSTWPAWFLLPALGVLGLVFAYPLVTVVRDSLYTGDAGALSFVGLGNYRAVLSDPVFVQSLENNLKLLLTVPVSTIGALIVALLLNDRIRGWRTYRAILFLPYVLPTVALGIAFSYLLQRNGVINSALRGVGAGGLALDWIGSSHVVMFSVGAVVVWQQMGLGILIFSAALVAVPHETVEAALTDGVSWWQLQRHVLVPQISRSIAFFALLQGIYVLSSLFSTVYSLTRGGPGTASSVLELYIWNSGFANGSVGVAATAAVLLLAVTGVFIALFARLWTRVVVP